MNGQVADDLSYGDWLRWRPEAFIENVLGPTKAKLFLDGELDMAKFVDLATSRPFTLDKLREKESEAWMRAGQNQYADHVVGLITGLAMKPEVFDQAGPGYRDNLLAHFDHMRKHDVYASYTVVPPAAIRDREIYSGETRRGCEPSRRRRE